MRVGLLKLRAQIFCGEEPAIGPGKADLLEAIAREGSISAAGRAMGMSYRRAWLLADAMNRCWSDKLVATSSAGARLTPCGEAVLAAYRALEQELARAAGGPAMQELAARVRVRPRHAQAAGLSDEKGAGS